MRARSPYLEVMRALFVMLLLVLGAAACGRPKGEVGKVAPGFGAAAGPPGIVLF